MERQPEKFRESQSLKSANQTQSATEQSLDCASQWTLLWITLAVSADPCECLRSQILARILCIEASVDLEKSSKKC